MPACEYCSKILSSNQRLQTHMASIHQLESVNNDSEQESVEDDESQNTGSINSKDMDTDNACDSQSSISGDDQDDLDVDAEVWIWLVASIIGDEDRLDLLKSDGSKYDSKKLVRAIRDKVEELIRMTNHLVSTKVYRKIESEKQKLMRNGYSDDEAIKTAWKKRHYLVKNKVIGPTMCAFSKARNQDNSDEDNSDEQV
jgi:hypothetical protein